MARTQLLADWDTPLLRCGRISMGCLRDDGVLALRLMDVAAGIQYEFLFDRFEAYRSTDESYLNRLWELRGDRIGFTFMVENSDWIAELRRDPVFEAHCSGCRHYVIATLDEGVEVISSVSPRIARLPD